METNKAKTNTIDEFIALYPIDVQEILKKVRATIKKAAPEAVETIAYGIPTFVLKGNLVHFSAYKNHIGFYPTSSGIARFKDELTVYKTSRGTVQFPLDKPIPYDLISKIVTFRVKENLEKAEVKVKK
jgi:uncharacterized protein YdhG (YjbR/CyaY superfamily)